MAALERKNEGLMHWIMRQSAWIAATFVAVSIGCKFANPIDRTVKVTQRPTVEEIETPSPRTRLAGGSITRDSDVPETKESSRTENARSPHESPQDSKAQTTVARKAPNSNSVAKPTSSLTPSKAAEVPVEYAELMEAFRDSPPEVQQQAVRQLIALSSRNAVKTDSPEGIAKALQSSVKELPELPEESSEPVTPPARIAVKQATQPAPAKVNEVAPASAEVAEDDRAEPVALASGKAEVAAPIATETLKLAKPLTDAELYVELIGRLEKGAAGESDADRYRRQIIARHLMMFSGNPDGAVAAIEGMNPSEQEFLRHYLLGMWSMVDTSGHPVAARRWSAALPEMRLATQQLSASAEVLDVRSLSFCKEIQSYGQITKFDSNRFAAGQKVILYCEIDNFTAQQSSAGYETHLQGSYEVFDSKGQKVAGQVLPADKQVCANYLRDYFIAYQMNLPSGLQPGEYRLELSMECLKGQKYGQASLPLVITAAR